MSKLLKHKLLEYCHSFVHLKQERLQSTIEDAQKSLESESQSTAGDKHDTSRAMMHLEIEKKSHQLAEIIKLKRVLKQIDPEKTSKTVGLGSIILTDRGSFFIAINGGKHKIDDIEYTIISLASPLAQNFTKAFTNIEFLFMKTKYTITEVY